MKNQRPFPRFILASSIFAVSVMIGSASCVATEQAQQRREGRDVKQDTRQESRETKVDCRAENQKSNTACRQDKRDTKQDGRQQARDIKY